jgi:pimeloyl-ACP methyl ester carboxylesterase
MRARAANPRRLEHGLVQLEKSRRLWLAPLEHTLENYPALPAGQLCILPATGHGTIEERPGEVDATIEHFLR